jgi:hypothetical protein
MTMRQSDERIVGSRKSDDEPEVRETKFTVKLAGPGNWVVCEAGFEEPLAEFEERDEAIEYARGVAASRARASTRTVTTTQRLYMRPLRWTRRLTRVSEAAPVSNARQS